MCSSDLFIDNNWDMAELLSELLGELNASHTGSGHRPSYAGGDATACLGAFYDNNYSGAGLRIEEVIEKSPLQKLGPDLRTGVIIEKLDGIEITAKTDIDPLLNRKADKPTLLAFFDPQSNKRWEETVKPISKGQEDELLYQRWVKQRREATERLSNGRLDLGVGVGWCKEEFQVMGAPFENRGARSGSYVEVMKRIWCDDPLSRSVARSYRRPRSRSRTAGHGVGRVERACRCSAGCA